MCFSRRNLWPVKTFCCLHKWPGIPVLESRIVYPATKPSATNRVAVPLNRMGQATITNGYVISINVMVIKSTMYPSLAYLQLNFNNANEQQLKTTHHSRATVAKLPKSNETFRWSCEECNRYRSDHVSKIGGTTIETSGQQKLQWRHSCPSVERRWFNILSRRTRASKPRVPHFMRSKNQTSWRQPTYS